MNYQPHCEYSMVTISTSKHVNIIVKIDITLILSYHDDHCNTNTIPTMVTTFNTVTTVTKVTKVTMGTKVTMVTMGIMVPWIRQ